MLGAFGHLHCIELGTGMLRWTCDLSAEFDAVRPKWGYAASPLLVGGKLIIQPGGVKSALVALDPENGDLIWESPGRRAAYASPFSAKVAGKLQIIACDATRITGRDAETGRQLWEIAPEQEGDFNVPTPFMVRGNLFAVSEGNGARIFGFDSNGFAVAKPAARFAELAPDTHTPAPVGKHVVGLHQKLFCLDAQTLKPVRASGSHDLGEYAAIISDGATRFIAFGENARLSLFDINRPQPIASVKVADEDYCLAHPALAGNRLYLRIENKLLCIIL